MQFYFFDKDDKLLFARSDAIEAHAIREELKHTATFPYNDAKIITVGMRVGWVNSNGTLELYEIRQPTTTEPDGVQSYEAEHIVISELTDCVVQDIRPYDVTASTALMSILQGTPWQVGTVYVNPTGSSNFYWVSAWAAVVEAETVWSVRFEPRLTFNGTQITGRFLDIVPASGTFYGVRLTLDRNVSQAGVTYDDRELATAMYGRGRGEIAGSTDAGDPTYGRKIDFSSVVWSTANGDPANKPEGQTYVEDVAATAAWGRNGVPRYRIVEFDTDDPAELLTLTWEALEATNAPKITIDMTVADLQRIGYAQEGMGLGDLVNVILQPMGIMQQAQVVQLDEDLLYPENTRPVIGDYRSNIIYKDVQTDKTAQAGAQIVQNAPGLLQGFIDTAVIGIMSSKTNRYTLPDGSEVYETEDGTKAVRFSGAGILLANGKTSSGDWNWRTAITGQGIVADEIATGTLNANLIKILGTGTYFDGTTLRIQHPTLGANTYTEIDTNGMRMISNGQVVGGLYKDFAGQVVTASGTLFNPASPVFQAYVGSQTSVGIEGYGIAMNYNGQYGGNIGVFAREETPDAPPAGAAFVTPGTLVLDGQSIQILSTDEGDITITSAAGMTFTFQGVNKAGQQMTLSFTAQDIWNAVITD